MKYRYHWSFKLLALVLAVISGAALILGCAGLILDDLGYYERSRLEQQYRELDIYCSRAANAVFDRFAWRDTGIEPKLFERVSAGVPMWTRWIPFSMTSATPSAA